MTTPLIRLTDYYTGHAAFVAPDCIAAICPCLAAVFRPYRQGQSAVEHPERTRIDMMGSPPVVVRETSEEIEAAIAKARKEG